MVGVMAMVKATSEGGVQVKLFLSFSFFSRSQPMPCLLFISL